ncbi:hypothetical protein Tco_0793679 [Tanacetum coccineum]
MIKRWMMNKITAKLKVCWNVILMKWMLASDAIPLATKPPSIVDWKIIKEGKIGYYQIIRANGNSKRFQDMHIFMWGERDFPLYPARITQMLNRKLQTDHCNEMCYQLLKLMTKQLKKQLSIWKHPPGDYEAFNEET